MLDILSQKAFRLFMKSSLWLGFLAVSNCGDVRDDQEQQYLAKNVKKPKVKEGEKEPQYFCPKGGSAKGPKECEEGEKRRNEPVAMNNSMSTDDIES